MSDDRPGPAGRGDEPARELPPAGNGSLGAPEEMPAAVPSSIFAAMHQAPGQEPPWHPHEALGEVAASGHGEGAESAILDAGPFDGLAELDAFQGRLSGLVSVSTVRLCHFADARAEFEAVLSGAATPLQREVRERLPDALVSVTEKGLRIDLGGGG